mgnify:CR=1 FL=1
MEATHDARVLERLERDGLRWIDTTGIDGVLQLIEIERRVFPPEPMYLKQPHGWRVSVCDEWVSEWHVKSLIDLWLLISIERVMELV